MSTVRTIKMWFASRPQGELWGALPAVLLGLAWAAFGLMLLFTHPDRIREYYGATAIRALAVRDYKTARVASQRHLLSWPDDAREQNEYELALAWFGLGQNQAGAAMLNLAAPVDQPGYAPAQLLLARYLLNWPHMTEPLRQQAERHLNHFLDQGTNTGEAHEMLGQIEFQRGEWAAAQTNLLAAVATQPDAGLLLAVLARKAGDTNAMEHWSGVALDYYYGRVTKAAADDPPDRLGWAQTLSIRENYPEAIHLLEAGVKQSGVAVYAPALAELYAYWAAKVAREEPDNLAGQLKLLQQGLAYQPQDFRLLEPLLALSQPAGADLTSARQILTNVREDQSAVAPLAQLLLAMDAAEVGDTGVAASAYARAFQQDPSLKVVANNLVLLLVLTKQPDLTRALALVQPMVEVMPNQPDFRNTRGQIYVKLGKWAAAVDDLEYALPLVLDKSATHTALAEAYQNLGMSALAAEHARLAHSPAPAGPAGQ